MSQIEVAGRRIHFDDAGRGPPLLLLHPFPFDARYFGAQLGSLPARAIAPDLSGAGRSDVPGDPAAYSVDAWAGEALAVLDACGVSRAVVVGVSMGGYVALALARRAPERLAGLVLADTRAAPDTDEVRARRTAQQERILGGDLAGVLDDLLPPLIAPGSPRAGEVRAMMARQVAAGVVGALQALKGRPDARPDLPRIRVPALAIAGEHDAITPPAEAARMAAAIPGARQAVIAGAGHLASLEQPEAFARELLSLL